MAVVVSEYRDGRQKAEIVGEIFSNHARKNPRPRARVIT
jgi:hypothetical protein